MSPQFDQAVQRGRKLLAMIQAPDTTQSKWVSNSSIEEHGWKFDLSHLPEADLGGMEKLFSDAALGVKRQESAFLNVHIDTPAYYDQVFSINGGTIFAKNILSPSVSMERRVESGTTRKDLPELQHWSDVTFLSWDRLREGTKKELKRVVHCDITNPEFQDVVAEVMGKKPGAPDAFTRDAYPGFVYTQRDGDVFEALLGTPNGMGTGYLLAQHKEAFAGKSVGSIQVFREENNYFLVMGISS